jgi:dihydrofolate reductase
MQWFFPTQCWRRMQGQDGGETGIDHQIAEQSFDNIGAWILGRNMFGPVRGPWPDESWQGWWGQEPPYHTPTAQCPAVDGSGGFTSLEPGNKAAVLDHAVRNEGQTSRKP